MMTGAMYFQAVSCHQDIISSCHQSSHTERHALKRMHKQPSLKKNFNA